MSSGLASHRDNCMCAICMRKRGEIRRTKKHFTISADMTVLADFREFARRKRLSLTQALEEAMRLYMESSESYDEEPLTDEELHGIKAGMADIKAGRVYDAEEVFRELGV